MKRTALVPVLLLGLLAAACGAARPASIEKVGYGGAMPPESFAAPGAPAAEFSDAAQATRSFAEEPAAVERVVLKSAELAIVVNDVAARLQDIDAMAKEMGGYVVSSNLYQTLTSSYIEVPEGSIVIRVPEDRLDEALRRIKQDSVEVQTETRSGQDVTSTYVDLQSRLKNLEAAEAQLVEIMNDARKTEDVISVFNQLVSYREQIEVVKGQIQYYDEASALSGITVRLIAEASAQPLKIGPWTPKGAFLEAVKDLTRFLRGFADFMIRFVIYTLPALILIAIPFVLIFLALRALVRLFRKPRAERTEPPKKTSSR